jgi:hypothetical protein
MRAAGTVVVAGQPVSFAMIAARPNRVRLETGTAGRSLVQGFDGVGPAWELEPGPDGPLVRPMPERTAKTFMADAEFDDPLISGSARGYVCEFAGAVEIGGRKHLRVLVTRRLTGTYHLLVDAVTFFIVRRIEQRSSVTGRKVEVVTEFADFRPVAGVLLAHQVDVTVDGKVTQQTRIDSIEANPVLPEGIFSRPKTPAAGDR